MDVPLGYYLTRADLFKIDGLNPCYSGCASRLLAVTLQAVNAYSLNPCYSGCASRLSVKTKYGLKTHDVLILVIVDVPLGLLLNSINCSIATSLNPCYSGCASRLVSVNSIAEQLLGLNPCYSGCASRLLT